MFQSGAYCYALKSWNHVSHIETLFRQFQRVFIHGMLFDYLFYIIRKCFLVLYFFINKLDLFLLRNFKRFIAGLLYLRQKWKKYVNRFYRNENLKNMQMEYNPWPYSCQHIRSFLPQKNKLWIKNDSVKKFCDPVYCIFYFLL